MEVRCPSKNKIFMWMALNNKALKPQGLAQLILMSNVCTLPRSLGGHRFDSHAPWGYSLPRLPSMNHGEVFNGFSTKLSSEKKNKAPT
jgi:hypothetical protein